MKGIKGEERAQILHRLMSSPVYVADMSAQGHAGTVTQRNKSKIKGLKVPKHPSGSPAYRNEGQFSGELWLDKAFFKKQHELSQDYIYSRDFLQQAYANELVHQIDIMQGGFPVAGFARLPGGGFRNIEDQAGRTKYLEEQNRTMANNLKMEWPKLDKNYLQNIKDNKHIQNIPEEARNRYLQMAAKGNMGTIHADAEKGELNEKQHWILWEMAKYTRGTSGPFTRGSQEGYLPTSAKSYGGAGDYDWAIGVGKGNKGMWSEDQPYFSQTMYNHLMAERLSHMGSVKIEGMQNRSRALREAENTKLMADLPEGPLTRQGLAALRKKMWDAKRTSYGILDPRKGFQEGGPVTKIQWPRLDKNYVTDVANNPHILAWLNDKENKKRFGWTGNETMGGAYNKMKAAADKAGIDEGDYVEGSAFTKGVKRLYKEGYITPEADAIMLDWNQHRIGQQGLTRKTYLNPHYGFDQYTGKKKSLFGESEMRNVNYRMIPKKGVAHIVGTKETLGQLANLYAPEMKAAGHKANFHTILKHNPDLEKILKQRAKMKGEPDFTKMLRLRDLVLIPGGEHLYTGATTRFGGPKTAREKREAHTKQLNTLKLGVQYKAEGGLIQGFQSGGIAITPEIKKSDWWRRGPGRQAQPTGRGVGHPGAYDPAKAKQALEWTGFWEGQEEFDRTGVRPTQSPYGDFPRIRKGPDGKWIVEPGWKPIIGAKKKEGDDPLAAIRQYLDKDGNWKKQEGGLVGYQEGGPVQGPWRGPSDAFERIKPTYDEMIGKHAYSPLFRKYLENTNKPWEYKYERTPWDDPKTKPLDWKSRMAWGESLTKNNIEQLKYGEPGHPGGHTGLSPLFKVKGKKRGMTPSDIVAENIIKDFTKEERTTGAIIFGEFGRTRDKTSLHRQGDVMGNTLRYRVDSPNFPSPKSPNHPKSLYEAATEGGFDAYTRKTAEYNAGKQMGAYMDTDYFKKWGWMGMRQQANMKGKGLDGITSKDITGYQAALFYASERGKDEKEKAQWRRNTLSARYRGITQYTSPAGKGFPKADRVVFAGPGGVLPGAHATVLGGYGVGPARGNPGYGDTPPGKAHKWARQPGVTYSPGTGKTLEKFRDRHQAFMGYSHPMEGNFGAFLNSYDEESALASAQSSFAPFLSRLKGGAGGQKGNLAELGRLWRQQGGAGPWMDKTNQEKFNYNLRMAKHLASQDKVGGSAASRFLNALRYSKGKGTGKDGSWKLNQFGEKILELQRGGFIDQGSGLRDDVPALLQKGEFVMRQSSVKKYGAKFFQDVNEGRVKFAEGGKVEQEILAEAQAQTDQEDEEAEVTGVRNPASLNERYGDNLAAGWQGAPGEVEMQGIATQEKVWYGGGETPGQGMRRTMEEAEKGFRFGGPNMFAFNDPEKPGKGKFFVDNKMSGYAMEDSNNPMNAFREKRVKLFVDYQNYLKEELKNRKKEWEDFRDRKKAVLKAGWIKAAVSVAQFAAHTAELSANEEFQSDDPAGENFVPKGEKLPNGQLKAGTPVNPDWAKKWGRFKAFTDTPLGAGLMSGTVGAATTWAMGGTGEQIAVAAGTAMATGAIGAATRIAAKGKELKNKLNSEDEATILEAEADMKRGGMTLTKKQQAKLNDRKEFAKKKSDLRGWTLREQTAKAEKARWERAIKNMNKNQRVPGNVLFDNRKKQLAIANARIPEIQEGFNAWRQAQGQNEWFQQDPRAEGGRKFDELHQPIPQVWEMNDKKRAALEKIKFTWAQKTAASNAARLKEEARAKGGQDRLGQMLRAGGGMIDWRNLQNKATGGLITKAGGGFIPGGEDDVPALLTRGEYVINRDAVRGNESLLDKLNRGEAPVRFAEGGPVTGGGGMDSQFSSPLGGRQALATPDGNEALTDSLIQLIDIVQSIRDRVDESADEKSREERGGQTGQTIETGVNQEITNNVSVTVNIDKNGSATSETETSSEGENNGETEEDEAGRNERFAELMQGVVLQTIIEEQRPGGLLYKT